MTEHTLLVCSLCRFSETQNKKHGLSGGQHLIEGLQKGLEDCDYSDRVTIKPVSCMAACRRSCAVTLAANDKLTFILERLSPVESAPDLLKFIEQYVNTSQGKVPYRERSRAIQQATAFILPPLLNSP
jgi:predicted metal-binding protein